MGRKITSAGVFWCLCLMVTTACTVGPDYQRPDTVAGQGAPYENTRDDLSQVVSSDGFSRWWRAMEDPLMDGYINDLLADNLQLMEAAARIRQAWAQLGIERGALYPGLSATGSAARRFQSLDNVGVTSGIPIPETGGTQRFYFTQLEAGLSTSWQVDLFGKVERSIAAARKNYLASRADTEALVHSLIAELARRRVALASLKRRLELTQQTVESRELTLKAVERRYRRGAGNVSAVDVYLARENVAAAAAEVPNLRRRMIDEAYALDLLLGLAPGTVDPETTDIPVLPPPRKTPVGLPAQLVDRRPDLKANELRMAAAVEQIGVAVANLYPDLTLSGSIGYQNDELNQFFNSSNLFGAILGDITAPLFQGGRLRANIELQEARTRELAAAYARQVLNALREVETALSNARYLSEQIRHLENRLENIRRAEKQMQELYRKGLVSLLEVLETQRRRYVAEQTWLVNAQAAWNNRIALYLALGGDWLENEPDLQPFPLPVESRDS